MFVCPELVEETERFRKLIFGRHVQILPSNKLRFLVENFQMSPNYDVISGFRKCEKSHKAL